MSRFFTWRRIVFVMVKLFILGRPGSGKSTAAHYLSMKLHNCDWHIKHINDYQMLRDMSYRQPGKILHRKDGGFDAIDFSVLDDVLKIIEKKVRDIEEDVDNRRKHLVTIEFARDSYQEALRQFSASFIEDAHFLFTDADIETCLERIHKRVADPCCEDDHPSFSDNIFRHHYKRDNKPYMQGLQKVHTRDRNVGIIENIGPLRDFLDDVELFLQKLSQEELVPIGD